MWVQSLDQEDAQEQEMVTQSSILAWKIPWAEEPGELQSLGSQNYEGIRKGSRMGIHRPIRVQIR